VLVEYFADAADFEFKALESVLKIKNITGDTLTSTGKQR
jgi:hypothetical protein